MTPASARSVGAPAAAPLPAPDPERSLSPEAAPLTTGLSLPHAVRTPSIPWEQAATAPEHRSGRRQEAATRRRVSARGRVAEVTAAPVTAPPMCTALLLVECDPAAGPARDPAPTLRLVWQGQRDVPGIEVGARVECSGRLCSAPEGSTIHNPRFEILARRTQR